MGEAKRRGQQARQAGDALRARIAAGDFGSDRPATGWLVVLDRSPRGLELLRVLAGLSEFEGLRTMLVGEAARLWDVSPLFPYLVLRGGPGSPAQRTALAASLERLTGDALPKAVRALAGERWGAELALAPQAEAAVKAAIEQLRG
ncbi:MAG TPA: hypothetical protein VLI72_01195 [Methylibium sp.]|nr:hypothetical protein [Methylibium sp.]